MVRNIEAWDVIRRVHSRDDVTPCMTACTLDPPRLPMKYAMQCSCSEGKGQGCVQSEQPLDADPSLRPFLTEA